MLFYFFGISLCAVRPGSGALLSKELRLLICVTPVIISKQSDSFNKPFLQGERELYFTDPEGKLASPYPLHPPACGSAESISAAPSPPRTSLSAWQLKPESPNINSLFPRLCMLVSSPLPLIFYWECCVCFITINALLLNFLQYILAAA